jgi:hypothetical protein
MPCDSTVQLDMSGWGDGTHTVMVALAQNDHTPVPNVQPAMITVTVDGSGGQVLPATGHPQSGTTDSALYITAALAAVGLGLAAGGTLLLRRRSQRA